MRRRIVIPPTGSSFAALRSGGDGTRQPAHSAKHEEEGSCSVSTPRSVRSSCAGSTLQTGSLPLRAKDIHELPGLQHALRVSVRRDSCPTRPVSAFVSPDANLGWAQQCSGPVTARDLRRCAARCAVTDCNRQLQRVSRRGVLGPYDARIVTVRVTLWQPASHRPPTHMQEVPGSSPGATTRHRNGRPVVSYPPPR